jgi:hypothetical protein
MEKALCELFVMVTCSLVDVTGSIRWARVTRKVDVVVFWFRSETEELRKLALAAPTMGLPMTSVTVVPAPLTWSTALASTVTGATDI